MQQLVVTVHPNGSIETLLKDKVLDTRKFADTRKVERLSEVLPTDDGQKFFVKWLRGPLLGSQQIPHYEGTSRSNHSVSCGCDGIWLYFDTYEQAVEHEVATVNALRLAGHSFA